MEKNSTSAEELKTIRTIMEESTRFLSLSGLAGVFMGLAAILGAVLVHIIVLENGSLRLDAYFSYLAISEVDRIPWGIISIALAVLLFSAAVAFYFSRRNAAKSGRSIMTPVAKRLLISLLIPLVTGGIFSFILMFQDLYQLIVPVLLIFYGLGLVNAGKFTYSEVFYLGLCEIFTGLVSTFFPALGLIFWSIGFGLMHIGYGIYMFRKYES